MPIKDDDCSTYSGSIIDDVDYEIALKVIRTIRNLCLGADGCNFFDADGAVILSHAHAKLKEIYRLAAAECTAEELTNEIQQCVQRQVELAKKCKLGEILMLLGIRSLEGIEFDSNMTGEEFVARLKQAEAQ